MLSQPIYAYFIYVGVSKDKVYTDGQCKLLRRGTIDKFLDELQEIPGPNRTENILVGKFQRPTILYTYCSHWSYL